MLRVRTGDTVQGRQLTDTESGDDSSKLLNSGVTISGVGGVQLVGVTSPSHAVNFVELIQETKVEVTWKTEDGVDLNLFESLEEVTSQCDFAHGIDCFSFVCLLCITGIN